MKKLLSILLALSVLFCAAGAGQAEAPEQALYEAVRAQAGSSVAGFSADRIDGGRITGAVFGEYSLCIVTYWATWSGDALRQLEYLNAIHEQRPDVGVMGILNTDSPGSEEAALEYMQAHGYDFPVFAPDRVWRKIISQTSVLPQTFFVSPSGIILEAFPGAFSSAGAMLDEAMEWLSPEGTYSVRFYDPYGGTNALLIQYLALLYGDGVEAPMPPQHEGMIFRRWSRTDYNYVTCCVEVFAVYDPEVPDGDIDRDGDVDAIDVLYALRISLGIMPHLPEYLSSGDMDGNGIITANDALILLRMCLYAV